MAVGVISTSTLSDIADAIRATNGSNDTYTPSGMAAAVAALDSRAASPGAVYAHKSYAYGLVDASALTAIADAIRAQNGGTATYRPSEMAEAILSLTWAEELKARALLLSDGTLELTYLANSASPSGGTVSEAFDVPAEALSAMGEAPWYASRESVTKVSFDVSFATRETASLAYWFDNMIELTSVVGVGNVAGCTSLRDAFGHDTKLAEVDLSGMDMTALADVGEAFIGDSALTTIWMSDGQAVPSGATAGSTFNLCSKLVGGNGTAYSATRTSGTYLRPDVEGTAGYGTVRS